jgi:hypothetical protein
MEYANEVLNEREKTHGDFEVTARLSNRLKGVWKEEAIALTKAGVLTDVQVESLDMICMKIARIISGDHNCKDSWDDIAGYANLVSERLK